MELFGDLPARLHLLFTWFEKHLVTIGVLDENFCVLIPWLSQISSIVHILDFSVRLASTCVFSKVDLVRGCHQITVGEKDVAKTAVVTLLVFSSFYACFSLPQNFSAICGRNLKYLLYLFISLIHFLPVVYSRNSSKHLELLFQRLTSYGLVIYLSLCQFSRN